MKTRSIFLILFLACQALYAQTSTGIAVQGIARDANKAAIVGQTRTFTFTLNGTPSSGPEIKYVETQEITTDAFGVFSHIIGTGTPGSGSGAFADVAFGKAHLSLKVEVDGGITLLDGPLQYAPYAKSADYAGNGVPVGGVIMWSGDVTKIPAGWLLCDGNNDTPNLSGRFIVGYASGDDDYKVMGKTGGEKTHTLTATEIPGHTHAGTTSQNGAHTHRSLVREANGLSGYWGNDKSSNSFSWEDGNNLTSSDGNHTHTFTTDHGTGGGGAHENRPPYYVLAYIMRVQ